MKLDFSNKTKLQKNALIGEGYFYLQEAAELGKSLVISEKKTLKQHRGYFRLIDLLLPYLSKSYGEINNKDDADDFIRIESGYFKVVKTKNKKIVLPRSIKTATKEDLMKLINKAYEACEFYDIKNYELTSAETQALVEYFNKKEI